FGLGDMRRCASTTALVVASSVDKAPLLSKLGADFSHRGPDVIGRCIAVRVVAKSSGAAETALADGWLTGDGPRPDVWSPSGSVWLPLLEDRLAAGQRSSLVPAPASVPSIAASPMVVAMPRPMAQALGWPDKPIGWSDLLQLASSGTGWARFGHPEWGQFRLGKTNPNFSHAGLEGTIAAYYAAVGRTSGLTRDDVASAQTRKFVAGVEQSIVRYGDNTVTFLSDWQRADATGQALSYISAVVTEENLVPSYNDGNPGADPAQVGKNPHPAVPLVAIYPREGTFIADHPYAVLSEPWVNADKRAAAAAFLDYLLSPKVQKVWQDNHYRDAQDRSGLGDGLADGVIPSQPVKVLQPPAAAVTNAVLTSWAQLRKTANVLNVMDVSGSMADRVAGTGKTKLEAAQQAAIASLGLFTDHDEVGLWTFSGGVAGKQDYTQLVPIGPMDEAVGPTVRRTALAQALQAATPGGNTGLYNTIFAAYRTVLARYQDDRINAVVILTDGKNDAVGGLDLKGLLDGIATASGGRAVRIFTIAYGPDADQSVLAQIAHATGGATYVAATPADISKVYSAALSNL
ncbi:MAG TPA: substrate-binding and VWA domain-containing protein, partial [Kineosporiaceae bacterium]|nr:substrate-binding and VWA domain-containing protein [Kineosporiaceae bacterium]